MKALFIVHRAERTLQPQIFMDISSSKQERGVLISVAGRKDSLWKNGSLT
jgi:hypothetical protein